MFNPSTIIVLICLYVGVLFLIATWVEKKSAEGGRLADNAVVYSLSLAIYCTSWTYYGSVGAAASSGMLFLTIHLGPTLSVIFWWIVLRKLVRIKQSHRVNSIADFMAARYGASHPLAAIATVIAVVGVAPYIALQFKAVVSTFGVITSGGGMETSWIGDNVGAIVMGLMIVFTIVFGVRRLDTTERRQGMVMAVAAASLVKLAAFLAAGVFATFFLFDGPGDVFRRLSDPSLRDALAMGRTDASFTTWATYLVLAMSAILFLPRQFHVAVVENSDENHIRTAMWLFPLYLFLMNIFVVPLAMGGQSMGLPPREADAHVLGLPVHFDNPWLSLLVFIGGFSAAMGMIMISAMTMAVMISNHLLLPMADWVPRLGFLRRRLLKARWAAVAAVIMFGYWLERRLGGGDALVDMGMLSFAAALQFAPPILGGIFWRGANRAGAIPGLSAGFLIWSYTLLLPSFVRSGWMSEAILQNGPWGVGFLNPERLFGVTGLAPLSHGVFWTLVFNIGLYVLGSLLYEESEEEKRTAGMIVDVLTSDAKLRLSGVGESCIDLTGKSRKIKRLLARWLVEEDSSEMIRKSLENSGLEGRTHITILELADLCGNVEKRLAGSIGTSVAHKAFRRAGIFRSSETRELSTAYGDLLAKLKLTPEELIRKIDYHRDREALISSHAAALEEKIEELEKEIRERRRAQKELRKTEERYRTLFTASPDPIVAIDFNGRATYINPAFEKTYGWRREEILGQRSRWEGRKEGRRGRIEFIPEHEEEKTWNALRRNMEGENVEFETRRLTKDGRVLDIHVNSAVFDRKGENPGVMVIHRDITERKRAEKELKRLRNLLKGIIDSMPSVLVGVEPDGNVTQWNREAERVTGVASDQARGRPLKEAFPALSGRMKNVRRAIGERKPLKDAKVPVPVDDEPRFWDVTVYPLLSDGVEGAVIRVDDVTERVLIDELMVQTEKMASVGGLAAGMAHEINNPLAGILQNVQVIRNRISGDMPKNRRTAEECGVSLEAVKTYMERRGIFNTIDTVMESGHRAAVIVDNMLTFSRKSDSRFAPHDLAQLLDKTVTLAENEYSLKNKFDFRDIRIVRDYAASLPMVPCEGSKIQQVFLNILKNGAQAMAEGGEPGRPPCFILRVSSEGDLIRVEIEDNGPGISGGVRKRVFDPFFTTKEVGLGTGLGMSVSYFIITQNHNGSISVESTPGKGAKFIIRLPVRENRASTSVKARLHT